MIFFHYDNPDTMAREVWQKGKLILSVSSTLIESRNSGFREFCPGYFMGDKAAMQVSESSA